MSRFFRDTIDTRGSIFPEGSPDELRRLRNVALSERSTVPSDLKSQDPLPRTKAMPGVEFRGSARF